MSLELIKSKFKVALDMFLSESTEESTSRQIKVLLDEAINLVNSAIMSLRNDSKLAAKNLQQAYKNADELHELRELLPELYYYLGLYHDKIADQLSDQAPEKRRAIRRAVRYMKASIATNTSANDHDKFTVLYACAHCVLAKRTPEENLFQFMEHYAESLACECTDIDLTFLQSGAMYEKYILYKEQYENIVQKANEDVLRNNQENLDGVSRAAQQELDSCRVTFQETNETIFVGFTDTKPDNETHFTGISQSFFYDKKVTPKITRAMPASMSNAVHSNPLIFDIPTGFLDDKSDTAETFYNMQSPVVRDSDASNQTAAAPARFTQG